jgi:kynurenine formamidase
VGPAVVIDISEPCSRNPDYLLAETDLATWEKKHGRTPAGSIVFIRTAWSKFWPDKGRYLGSSKPGDTKGLHFPGISAAAAKFLVDRKIDGVGIDTASLDYGQSVDFQAHRILNGAGIYGLENVANLERVPATGATVIALPMKIRNGTGGPVRIMAILP